MEIYEEDLDTECYVEMIYLEAEAYSTLWIFSDDVTYSSDELDGKYVSEHYPDVEQHTHANVDTPDDIDFNGDVNFETDGLDKKVDDEEEPEEEVQAKMEEEDKEEEEDNYEDDGKEPLTMGQGEMVKTSDDNIDTMVDDQSILLPE